MKRVLLTILLAITLLSSVLPAESTPLSPCDVPNSIDWDVPLEEETSSEEGFEDDRILTEGIELTGSDGTSAQPGSWLITGERIHHWEVSAPPPR